jgi:tRNA (guanine-N7-)-methyltransferase
MYANSSPVHSNQAFCHPDLARTVARHLGSSSQRPLAPHTRTAFAAIADRVHAHAGPVILDSYCGTGMSSVKLAQQHREHLIIGIDQSEHRLGRSDVELPHNCLLVRADCGDFWRQALAARWHVSHHFLLYPNPWPKQSQLKRRVHGRPEFATLLALGGQLELRSNWQIYVEEFGLALVLAGQVPWIDQPPATDPLTLFERKYRDSGHQLWRCQCRLGHNGELTGEQ